MLAACRSLHGAGYNVTAASSTALAAAQWSRSCSRRLRVVDARDDASRFVEQLRDELTHNRYGTLVAGSDSSLLAISQRREQLEELTTLGLPSHSIVERALQRETIEQAARQAGLSWATSIRCVSVEQALAAAHQLGFPVAVKSISAARYGRGAVESVPKGRVVSTAKDLAVAAAGFRDGLLIQRWIAGELVSFGGVFAGGRLLGVAVSRYKRTWPPEGGSVSFSETISSPDRLHEAVQGLVLALGWEGIFELELIQSRTGEFVPIDFNPRPYGSMALANTAGSPLAAIWCDWLLRRHLPSNPPQPVYTRPGMRYRWEDGDMRHLAWQLRQGHHRAALKPLRPSRHVTHAHFQVADPLPLLARGIYLGKRLWDEDKDSTG